MLQRVPGIQTPTELLFYNYSGFM
uniref:Uncharacterized protein n=1 Tax=Rhizophora mucronata TaxID=61149 RepID=A0A2P2NWP5_RHIMU